MSSDANPLFRLLGELGHEFHADAGPAPEAKAPEAAEAIPPEPLPPRLGRYKIQGELGRGGMGRVLRGYDPLSRRAVAVKIMELTGDPARFQREAQAAARLSHPNIVTMFDVGLHEGQPYMAMELVDGSSLDSVWEVWPLAKKVEAVEVIARAVAYAHDQGVVHRDLKPSNVMVTAQGVLKLMDLGLAHVEGASKLTLTGAVMGTPAYMAPEQVRGEASGAPADIYALGVILYEAVTGVLPFLGVQPHEIYVKILSSEPMPPRRYDHRIPVDLEVICLKALEKETHRRYSSALELAEDLRRWRRGEPIRAKPVTWSSRILKRIKRNRRMWVAYAAAVLGIAAGLVVAAKVAAGSLRERRAQQLAYAAGEAYGLGRFDEAERLAAEALELNLREPQARYWRARLKLREYQRRRGIPDARVVSGLVEVELPAPEGPAERSLREEIEAAFRDAPGEALGQGVLLLWSGQTAESLARLQQVDPATPQAWEAQVYMAVGLYLQRRFKEARDLLARHVDKDPEVTRPIWVRVLLADGLEQELRGESPLVAYQAARDEALKIGDDRRMPLAAEVEVAWGDYLASVGQDAERMFQDAMAQFDQALSRVEDIASAEAHVARGDALLAKARLLASRGRVDLNESREFMDAIGAYGNALVLDEARPRFWLRRALAWREVAQVKEKLRRNDPALWGQVLADAEQALGRRADYAEAVVAAAEARLYLTGGSLEDLREACRVREREVGDAMARQRSYLPLAIAHADALLECGLWLGGEEGAAAYGKAIDELTDVLADHPSYAEALFRRGIAHYMLGNHERGQGRDVLSHYPQAVEDLENAAGAGGSAAAARERLAVVWNNWGDFLEDNPGEDPTAAYERAMAEATAALSINPSRADSYVMRGMARSNLGVYRFRCGIDSTADLDAAVADYTIALSINPQVGDTWMSRGVTRRSLAEAKRSRGADPVADYEGAIEDFGEALRKILDQPPIFNARADARLDLASYLIGEGRDPIAALEGAILDYGAVLVGSGPSVPVLTGKAAALRLRGNWRRRQREDPAADYEAALEEYTRAVGIDGSDAQARLGRGGTLLELGRSSEAVADLQEALRLDAGLRAVIEPLLDRARRAGGDEF